MSGASNVEDDIRAAAASLGVSDGRAGAQPTGNLPRTFPANEALLAAYRRGDLGALDRLLEKNEPLLHHALKRFSYSSEPYEDLFQVARLGFMKAVHRYDETRGTAFSTYAIAIADGEIRHHLRDALLVRQPRWARGLYAHIVEAQTEFFREHGRSPTIAEVAALVNIQEKGVLEIIRAQANLNVHSLDEPFDEPDGGRAPDRTLVRSIRAESFSLPIEDRILLYEALGVLSDLQKKIIYLLFFRDLTQQEVADEIGLTQRAVSRENVKAMDRLKAILSKRVF